jgi:hypothetical protein
MPGLTPSARPAFRPCPRHFPRTRIVAYVVLGALLLDHWLSPGTFGLLSAVP